MVVVLGGALWLTARGANRAADESIVRSLAATQSAIRDALASRTAALLRVSAGLAQVPAYVSRIDEAIRNADRSALVDQAEEFREQTGAAWVLVTDDRGIVRAWTWDPSLFDEDFSDASPVRLALAGDSARGTWIEPGPDGDLIFQVIAVPIFDPSRTAIYGALLAALDVDAFLVDELKANTSSDVAFFVLDTLGQPVVRVATVDPGELGTALNVAGVADWPAYLEALAGGDTREESQPRITMRALDQTLVGVAGPLTTADGAPLGGYIGFRSRDRELAAYSRLQRTMALTFGLGVILALLFSLVLARQITGPVTRLAHLANRVSEGQYSGTIDIRSRDEVGQLAEAFRRMMQELRAKEQLVEFLKADGGASMPDVDAPTLVTGDRTVPGTGTTVTGTRLDVGSAFADRYRIESVLGAGGMGVVYRARDLQLDEPVAIKTLRSEALETDPSLVERFKQEIRLARRITHRNVVRTHDLGEWRGMYYITMEYVEGQTLKDLIRRRGRLPAWVVVTVGKQLCRALEVAHEQGIVHRDIKPQNVIVDGAGFLKVMDFGIARLAQTGSGDAGLTAVGTAVGTPDYMAPEQMMGEAVDARTDLYALGVVLFECLTGNPPFEAPTVPALMMSVLHDAPTDPSALNPGIPPALTAVVLRALAKKPDDRWPTATALRRALEAIRIQRTVAAAQA